MERVRLPAMTTAAAEAALAELWCRLEQYGLSSPKLDVLFEDAGAVHISLVFTGPAHANAALPGWGEALARSGEPTPEPIIAAA